MSITMIIALILVAAPFYEAVWLPFVAAAYWNGVARAASEG